MIEDNQEYLSHVQQLLNTSRVMINFKDFFPLREYYKQWRWRIAELEILLLDENDNVIPSVGVGMGQGITFGITFPSLFNDTDYNKVVHAFLAQQFYCRSTYETESKLIKL